MAEPIVYGRLATAAFRRSLVTPEGVDLSLTLADFGQRFTAFLLDLLFMLLFLIAVTILCVIGGLSMGGRGAEVAAIVWLLGFFLLRNFYFILMESGPRAATFGKRITGLRVVARSGDRLTADRVIARNLVREIEFYLPLSFLGAGAAQGTADGLMALLGLGWAAIFLFFPLLNRDRLRIGDLLAGTWVINAPKRKLGIDLLDRDEARPEYAFTREQLDAYGVYELQTLEQVLREDRPEAIATVAEAIARRIGWDAPYFELDFLRAYYEAARAHMEQGLLFGRRRAHKLDR